jgi:HlyD family secretion protein
MVFITSMAFMTSCGAGEAQATPTPFDASSPDFQPFVTATGELVPQQWAELSVATSANAEALLVEVGDQVEEGQLLVQLSGHERASAALTAAELDQLRASLDLMELKENADLDRSQAEFELANARDALHDAEYLNRVRQQGNRASPETLDAAEARLVLAEDSLNRAQNRYDHHSGRPSDSPARAIALRNLANARQDRDAALRTLNWYKGSPTEIDQAMLDADVAVATARVDAAERKLERMENGQDERLLAAAEARLANAEAQVEAARSAVEDLELRAPFSGTVSELMVRENEWVLPGTPLLVLGDLSQVQIETTDLNEIDAARVAVGDRVIVTFDAMPELTVEGEVTSLAPKSSGGGGVNYSATISLEQVPEGLLWGMTAFVDIEVAQ